MWKDCAATSFDGSDTSKKQTAVCSRRSVFIRGDCSQQGQISLMAIYRPKIPYSWITDCQSGNQFFFLAKPQYITQFRLQACCNAHKTHIAGSQAKGVSHQFQIGGG